MIKAIGNLIGVLLVGLAGVLIWIAGYVITDNKLAGDVYDMLKKAFRD